MPPADAPRGPAPVTAEAATGTTPEPPRGSDEETPLQTLERNVVELLQELRVAQAGVQILFAFLLSLAFSQRFEETTDFQRGTYLVTLLASACSTIFFIAPVAYHRMVFRRRLRPELVRDGNRLAIVGLAFLALAMCGAVLLVADVVLGGAPAVAVGVVVPILVIALWYALPLVRRRGHPSRDVDGT